MNNTEKLNQILSTVLQIEPDAIRDEVSSDDVETWDSLNHIALMGALEQEFSVQIDVEQVEDSRSVGALKTILTELGISFANDQSGA